MAPLPVSRPHFLRALAGRGWRRPSWCGPPPRGRARRRCPAWCSPWRAQSTLHRDHGAGSAHLKTRPAGVRASGTHSATTTDMGARLRGCQPRRAARATSRPGARRSPSPIVRARCGAGPSRTARTAVAQVRGRDRVRVERCPQSGGLDRRRPRELVGGEGQHHHRHAGGERLGHAVVAAVGDHHRRPLQQGDLRQVGTHQPVRRDVRQSGGGTGRHRDPNAERAQRRPAPSPARPRAPRGSCRS